MKQKSKKQTDILEKVKEILDKNKKNKIGWSEVVLNFSLTTGVVQSKKFDKSRYLNTNTGIEINILNTLGH